jgi:hypothetical protein
VNGEQIGVQFLKQDPKRRGATTRKNSNSNQVVEI